MIPRLSGNVYSNIRPLDAGIVWAQVQIRQRDVTTDATGNHSSIRVRRSRLLIPVRGSEAQLMTLRMIERNINAMKGLKSKPLTGGTTERIGARM